MKYLQSGLIEHLHHSIEDKICYLLLQIHQNQNNTF